MVNMNVVNTVHCCFQCICNWLSLLDSSEEDKILAEGVGRFCEDLRLDPTSKTVLIIAWRFRAATQCEFTRKEFVDGMSDLWYENV